VVFLDLQNGRVGEMIVVAMADNNNVDFWYPLDINWLLCISFWPHPREWRASLFKDGIKEDAEATRELRIVTGMT
jgi:hypothetical protein